jgi:hypothetical protein
MIARLPGARTLPATGVSGTNHALVVISEVKNLTERADSWSEGDTGVTQWSQGSAPEQP